MQVTTAQVVIDERNDDDWKALVFGDEWTDKPTVPGTAALRALTDYAADIVTVMRTLGSITATGPLGKAGHGSALWHGERAFAGLATRATGGRSASALTTDRVVAWATVAGIDSRQALSLLADEWGRLLHVLNVASGHPDLHWVATSSADSVYGHAEGAHIAVLTLLAGNGDDGRRLHELWSDNQETTEHNMRILVQDKRAASVIVTVAADGDTATLTLPGNTEQYTAGRVEGQGLLWVADPEGEVIGHRSAWTALGQLLIGHYFYPANTPVIVEYASR